MSRNADGEIPLHTACKYDENNDIVEILLGCKARKDGINYQQKLQLEATNEIFGNTALHVAACLGNEKIVSTILKCEDGKLLLKNKNKMRDTPVHGAASRGHLRYVYLIRVVTLSASVSLWVCTVFVWMYSVLELMYQTTKDCIYYEGRFKGLPLHSACGYGRLEVVKKLLQWDESIATLEHASVPVVLPAFTKTTESVAFDPVFL